MPVELIHRIHLRHPCWVLRCLADILLPPPLAPPMFLVPRVLQELTALYFVNSFPFHAVCPFIDPLLVILEALRARRIEVSINQVQRFDHQHYSYYGTQKQ